MVHEKGELPVYNSNLELLWIKGDAINNHPGQQVSTTTVLGKVLPKGPDDLAPSRLSGPSMPLSLAHATSVLFELSQEAQVCLLRPPHLPFPLSFFPPPTPGPSGTSDSLTKPLVLDSLSLPLVPLAPAPSHTCAFISVLGSLRGSRPMSVQCTSEYTPSTWHRLRDAQ